MNASDSDDEIPLSQRIKGKEEEKKMRRFINTFSAKSQKRTQR